MNSGRGRRRSFPDPTPGTGTAALGKSWAELPAANTSVTEICHYITDVAATGNGSYPRNFAMGYDKAKKAALWAAYPLHAYYTAPNASKERAYSADLSLGKTEQMVGGVGAPYNKGHQVPNADRKVSNLANKQISYYSNMTPQLATFNSGAWGTLETRVRGWMCDDTLYVVTGCYFDGTRVQRPTTAVTHAPYRRIITRYCCAPSRAPRDNP